MIRHGAYTKPGPNIIRRFRFWAPLIGLYTGMRLNEICQLETHDIFYEEGVPIIDISRLGKEGPKKTKTRSSIRQVPIHPELQKIGFMEFVEEQRKAGSISIFPEIPEGTEARYKSDHVTQKVNRFFKSLGLKDHQQKKDFHSFRKTLATAMKKAGIPEDAKDEIGGWAIQGTRKRHYEERYSAREKYEFLCKVKYDGLDLAHLHLVSAIN